MESSERLCSPVCVHLLHRPPLPQSLHHLHSLTAGSISQYTTFHSNNHNLSLSLSVAPSLLTVSVLLLNTDHSAVRGRRDAVTMAESDVNILCQSSLDIQLVGNCHLAFNNYCQLCHNKTSVASTVNFVKINPDHLFDPNTL